MGNANMSQDREYRDAGSMLSELSASEEIADGLSERAEILEERIETFEIVHTERLDVDDRIETKWIPYPQLTRRRDEEVRKADRFKEAPTGFTETNIQFIEPEEDVRDCPTCSGSGRTACPSCSGTQHVSCDTCHGNGYFDCEYCDDGHETCDNCGGGGKTTYHTTTQCSRCGGAGAHQCPQCGGAGTHTCPECDGDDQSCFRCGGDGRATCSCGDGTVTCTDCTDGEVTKRRKKSCPSCGGSGSTDCSECGGTQRGERCDTCRGDGRVPCGACEDGSVTCGSCEESGRQAKTTLGLVTFRYHDTYAVQGTRIRSSFFNKSDKDKYGTLEKSRQLTEGKQPPAGTSGTYRKQKHVYSLSCKYVKYQFNGEEYEVVQIGDDIRYNEYPHSGEHLQDELEAAHREGRFTLGRPVEGTEAVTAAVTRTAKEAGWAVSGLVAGALIAMVSSLFIGLVIGLMGDPVPADAVVFGLVFLLAAPVGYHRLRSVNNRYNDFVPTESGLSVRDQRRSNPAYTTWDITVPLLVVGSAYLALALGLLGTYASITVLAVAVAVWASQVGSYIQFSSKETILKQLMSEEMMNELNVDEETISKHDLSGYLETDGTSLGTDNVYANATFVIVWPAAIVLCVLSAFAVPFGTPPFADALAMIVAATAVFAGAGLLFFGSRF